MGRKRSTVGRKSTGNPATKRVVSDRKKRAVRKQAKKRKSRSTRRLKEFPDQQGIAENPSKSSGVGYKNPPVEHQFKPGQSGNPDGCPRGRSYLHWWICRFLAMTPGELRVWKKNHHRLTASQRTAMTAVEQLVKRGIAGTAWLAIRELMHYDEGKPLAHVTIDEQPEMSDEECEAIREKQRQRMERRR